MNCLNCSTETSNPKFCSRSCAATHNNHNPKRKLSNNCIDCNKSIHKGRSRCKECYMENKNKSWQNKTLRELKKGNANNYGYPMIRQDSRRKYIKSGQPMECAICKYNFHVDICHKKDIKTYGLDTPIYVINDITNLVALCKNHHYEYDKGYLSDPDVGVPAILDKTRLDYFRLS